MIPESVTARGISRCGFSISSLALLVSSKPTHWKTRTPMTPMKAGPRPSNMPPRLPLKPCWAPEIKTSTANPPKSASLTIAPRFGTHFMERSERIFIVTATQIKARPTMIDKPVLPPILVPQSASRAAIAVAARVPPSQIGLLSQYRTAVIAPAMWPKARRTHSYGPPSTGKVVPSSDVSSP